MAYPMHILLCKLVYCRFESTLKPLVIIFAKQLCSTYFCGFSVMEICAQNFFARYGDFVGHGLCYTASALAMLTLKANRTARMVEMTYTDKEGRKNCHHRWVEVRFHHVWWVLDLAWTTCGVCLRQQHRREVIEGLTDCRITRICRYEEFWSYPMSHQLYDKLRKPETSWLLVEILLAYSRCGDGAEAFFNQTRLANELQCDGTVDSPHMYLEAPFDDENFLISRRIVCELMARSKRTQPKTHTIRKARKLIYKIRCRFIQHLDRNDCSEHAQDYAASVGIDYWVALKV